MKRILLVLIKSLAISLALCTVIALCIWFALDRYAIAPRLLARYVEHRIAGHNDDIHTRGMRLVDALMEQDRGSGWRDADNKPHDKHAASRLANSASATLRSDANSALKSNGTVVASSPSALQAIAQAKPGDIISFAPGTYRFDGKISVSHAGTEAARITVRAQRPGTVVLEFNLEEGFHVSAPYWTFENLTIRGICPNHSACEHAFHVTGGAHHFIARNNRIADFNAHFKINGADGRFPDSGVLEGNHLSNGSVRRTGNPVTPIDLVGASDWRIEGNFIADFFKQDGDQVSYAAFAKGGGDHNRFVRNVVLCEHHLRNLPGARIGLSLGGGGTSPGACRDQQCAGGEQKNSLIEANLIAACSDVGIYLNRAAETRVIHNTVLDTAGIDVRFTDSTATLEGNLVDGIVRSRNGGVINDIDNIPTSAPRLYAGSHPVRDLFQDSGHLNLKWRNAAPRRAASTNAMDLCGSIRAAKPAYGAFEDFAACDILLQQWMLE